MTRLSVIITFFLSCVPLFGQQQFNYVATTGNVALSAAATSATLQQPTSNGLPVIFSQAPGVGATAYCSVACTVSLIIDGTVASTTAGTVKPTISNTPAAVVTFFTASNTSGGTTLYLVNLTAGQTYNFDLSALKLGGASRNITLTTSSITGNANLTFFPIEIH